MLYLKDSLVSRVPPGNRIWLGRGKECERAELRAALATITLWNQA